MKKNIYCLFDPEIYESKRFKCGHNIYFIKNKTIIVPESFSAKNINPKNFLKLKKNLAIKSILIFDRTKPTNQPSSVIIDHINRSGFNFLIGTAPVANLPMFPDMSRIYNPIDGYKEVVVHTVGPSRFKDTYPIKNTISESVGLIAPVWHYVGVLVFAKTKRKRTSQTMTK